MSILEYIVIWFAVSTVIGLLLGIIFHRFGGDYWRGHHSSPPMQAPLTRGPANTDHIEILLAEDNMHDAEITIRTLKKHNFLNPLKWVKDGQEALDFLFCEGAYTNRRGEEPPKLILLDIEMSKVTGIEVLHKIKADAKLCMVPIVIMTSSSEQPDVAEAYRLGVNSYVVKPVDSGAFAETLEKAGWIATHRGV
jgi:two-component system, response regulator